jgi:cell division protein FtsB
MKTFKKFLVVMLFLFLYGLFSGVIYAGFMMLFSLSEKAEQYVNLIAYPGGLLLSSLICGKLFKGRYNITLQKWCTGYTVVGLIGVAFAVLLLLASPEMSGFALLSLFQFLLIVGAAQLSKNRLLDEPEWQEPAPREEKQKPVEVPVLPVSKPEKTLQEEPEQEEMPQPPKPILKKNHKPKIIAGIVALVVIVTVAIIVGVVSSNSADSLSAEIEALKEENAALQEELTAAQDNLAALKEEDLALDEQIASLDEQLIDAYETYDLHLEICSVCSEMMDCRFCGSFDDYLYEKYIDHLDRH